jgi:hypothetical protein
VLWAGQSFTQLRFAALPVAASLVATYPKNVYRGIEDFCRLSIK